MKAILTVPTTMALFLFASSNFVIGQSIVNLSLNLHYTDSATPALGGKWFLIARTNAANGIASVAIYVNNINANGIVYGNGGVPGDGYQAAVTATTLGALENNGQPYVGVFGGTVNLIYGQDTASGPIILDVGQGNGTPGNIQIDPLGNSTWNNSALIAKGTFGANTPVFTSVGSNSTSANVLANSSTTPGDNNFGVPANVTTLVRALITIPGDYNGNGVVDAGDYVVWRKRNGTQQEYTTWRSRFGQPAGSSTGPHWDASGSAIVPEPRSPAASIALLLGVVSCLRSPQRICRRFGVL